MKADIHPNYHAVNVTCTCGNAFEAMSTYANDSMSIEICAKCHPFYTGEQKIIDTEGNVEKFNKKFGKVKQPNEAKNDKKQD
jgi:large subunit ribosomal protein L31